MHSFIVHRIILHIKDDVTIDLGLQLWRFYETYKNENVSPWYVANGPCIYRYNSIMGKDHWVIASKKFSQRRLKAILLYRMTRSRAQSQKHTTELSELIRRIGRALDEEWPPVEKEECGTVSQGRRNHSQYPYDITVWITRKNVKKSLHFCNNNHNNSHNNKLSYSFCAYEWPWSLLLEAVSS